MKSIQLPKNQSKSLKKQVINNCLSYEKSKSVQKKSNAFSQIPNNVALIKQNAESHNFALYQESADNEKQMPDKQKNKIQKYTKKRPVTSPCKKAKNFIGNKLEKRLQSYYLFLALARNTIGSPICKYTKIDKKYIVFVGKGNNAKLVKKLFCYRHWWTITNDPKTPNINLIWTQWSKKLIFNCLQQEDEGAVKQKHKSFININQFKKGVTLNQYNYLLQTKQRDATKSSFVQTQNDVKAYLNISKKSNKKLKDVSFTCNHIEGHEILTDKKNLLYCLQAYCTQNRQNCFDIVPLSFHIKGQQQQFKTLSQIQKQISQEDKRVMWICKPGQKSNRGNGIKVFKKILDIRDHLQTQSDKHPERTFIIQRYIYPALFHRRKFDIRCFVLVVASPAVSAYFYNDGYLRTSSKQFKQKKFDDKFMHLTNDAIQKKGSDYGKFQKGNKISFQQYQAFLDLFEKQQINFKKQILPRLKSMAAKSIAAGSRALNSINKKYSFQLLGYDFMLDESYKPWLIQVNTNPCLQVGCPVLDKFIPSVVNNAIKIAVDSVFKPPKVNNWNLQEVITFPDLILQQNKYQLIFQECLQ